MNKFQPQHEDDYLNQLLIDKGLTVYVPFALYFTDNDGWKPTYFRANAFQFDGEHLDARLMGIHLSKFEPGYSHSGELSAGVAPNSLYKLTPDSIDEVLNSLTNDSSQIASIKKLFEIYSTKGGPGCPNECDPDHFSKIKSYFN